MYYSGNADSSCRTDFNTNAVFRMSYEPLGFWDRLFEYVCNLLGNMVEGAAVEQERKDVPPGVGRGSFQTKENAKRGLK